MAKYLLTFPLLRSLSSEIPAWFLENGKPSIPEYQYSPTNTVSGDEMACYFWSVARVVKEPKLTVSQG